MDIPITSDEKPELVVDFQEWLIGQRPEGGNVIELAGIIMSVMAQMRSVLLFSELHATAHNMLTMVENALRTHVDTVTPDGEKIPVILAEYWRDEEDGSALYDFLRDPSPNIPDTIPEDWDAV